jgi:hypothetical protein
MPVMVSFIVMPCETFRQLPAFQGNILPPSLKVHEITTKKINIYTVIKNYGEGFVTRLYTLAEIIADNADVYFCT